MGNVARKRLTRIRLVSFTHSRLGEYVYCVDCVPNAGQTEMARQNIVKIHTKHTTTNLKKITQSMANAIRTKHLDILLPYVSVCVCRCLYANIGTEQSHDTYIFFSSSNWMMLATNIIRQSYRAILSKSLSNLSV